MAITNEMDVTPLKGVLSNLTKLEWTLLKPLRISKTIINIYPNKNYEMIEAINSVENGKPITVTKIPSAATIQIYIHGKIDNLKPVISRPKLFEAYKILIEINPFYKNIEYNPNFKFTNTCVKFDKKISNPDYSILIDESGNDRNLADLDFYGIDQDLNPLQQGFFLFI
uniref:Uncharacterized protein n=1 Tax=Panagrolaimus superbus TaxID=310955 RepID=A0A914Y223_9BILA